MLLPDIEEHGFPWDFKPFLSGLASCGCNMVFEHAEFWAALLDVHRVEVIFVITTLLCLSCILGSELGKK